MKRNLASYAASGAKRLRGSTGYSLTTTELLELGELANSNELLESIAQAFYVGVEAGYRFNQNKRRGAVELAIDGPRKAN